MSHRRSSLDQGMYGHSPPAGSSTYSGVPPPPQGYYPEDSGIPPPTQLAPQPATRQRTSSNTRRTQINQGLALPPPPNLSIPAPYDPLSGGSLPPPSTASTPGYSREQPPRQKSKAYTTTIAAQSDDLKYQAKYKDLKRKVREIEMENDKLNVKVLKTKRNIQRIRLERAILYERLAMMGETIDPPAHFPHTDVSLIAPAASSGPSPVDAYTHAPSYRDREPQISSEHYNNHLQQQPHISPHSQQHLNGLRNGSEEYAVLRGDTRRSESAPADPSGHVGGI